MINLIPEVVRTQIVKEYWIRVATVFFFMLAVASVLMAVFALPVYTLINAQVSAYTESASAAAARVAEYDVSSAALVDANNMAQKMTALRNLKNFTNLVSVIEGEAGEGVKVSGFSFARETDTLSPILVTGEAKTRQDLANFRDSLLKQPEIAEAVLPISNLAKDRDIDFTLSIKLKEEKK